MGSHRDALELFGWSDVPSDVTQCSGCGSDGCNSGCNANFTTDAPTLKPVSEPPSGSPTASPSVTRAPSFAPTASLVPSAMPSPLPTPMPSMLPTPTPTALPSQEPTFQLVMESSVALYSADGLMSATEAEQYSDVLVEALLSSMASLENHCSAALALYAEQVTVSFAHEPLTANWTAYYATRANATTQQQEEAEEEMALVVSFFISVAPSALLDAACLLKRPSASEFEEALTVSADHHNVSHAFADIVTLYSLRATLFHATAAPVDVHHPPKPGRKKKNELSAGHAAMTNTIFVSAICASLIIFAFCLWRMSFCTGCTSMGFVPSGGFGHRTVEDDDPGNPICFDTELVLLEYERNYLQKKKPWAGSWRAKTALDAGKS